MSYCRIRLFIKIIVGVVICNIIPAIIPASHASMALPASFNVSPSGAATYTIPLAIPPGAAGMTPQLSLTYSSQAGDGQLGLGWGLGGLSVIARCSQTMAQDGQWRGIQNDMNDRYCLDGQRLIAIQGSYGAHGTEYRTEQESFSKIVSYGSAGNGPAWFKVWTKSGQIMEFGNTADSRIEPRAGSTPRLWAVNAMQDTQGNTIAVTYTEDNAYSNYYPTRINYTGNAVTGASPNASVQFLYEAKPDISGVQIAGSMIRNTVRMTKIQAYAGSALVNEYRLAYLPDVPGSQISAITQCDGNNVCLPAATFQWQAGSGVSGLGNETNWGAFALTTSSPWWSLTSGDLNGDGYADLLALDATNGMIYAAYSTGSAFGQWVAVDRAPAIRGGESFYAVVSGDVNGDGRADIIAANGNVWLSMENSWAPSQPWGGSVANDELWRLAAADMNGDGYADLLTFHAATGTIYTAYSTGSAFSNPKNIGQAEYAAEMRARGQQLPSIGDNWIFHFTSRSTGSANTPTIGTGYFDVALGDVNGDGRADIVSADSAVWLATDDGFAPRKKWTLTGATAYWVLTTADLNGDSHSDLLGIDALTGDVNAAYSTGGSFSYPVTSLGAVPSSNDSARYGIAFGDFNGDTRIDLAASNGKVRLGQSPIPPFISTFANGLGSTVTVSYQPLTNSGVYTADTGAVYPIRDIKPQGPIYVTAQTQTVNDMGDRLITSYRYGGMKTDLKGRGALGFRWIEITSNDTGLVTRTEYRQDWPYAGLPAVTMQSLAGAGNGGILTQQQYTYGCNDFVSASGCTAGAGRRYFPYVSQSTETRWDLNGAVFPTISAATQYDNWGNPTRIAVSASDGHSKTTVNTYTNDTVNWLLGRLTGATVTSTAP